MKSKWISFALALVMMFSLLPKAAAASAERENLSDAHYKSISSAAASAASGDECPFTDVPSSSWYRKDVVAAYNSGFLKGRTSTTFNPDGTLTVSEAVTLAARLHQYEADGVVTLRNGSPWYSTYVNYAKENGIIGNEYDGMWGNAATRAQMVKILYYSLNENRYGAVNTVEDNAIPDIKIGWEAADEVYTFYRAGILTGDNSKRFNPNSSIKRSEVAAILNRMMNPSQRMTVTLTLPALPGYRDAITTGNIVNVLDHFDPDGAAIIRYLLSNDVPGTSQVLSASWSAFPNPSIVSGLSTAVHEGFHLLAMHGLRNNMERIYIGNAQYYLVQYTDCFDSAKIAGSIPAALKTGRYSKYIDSASASATSASRQDGIYGLLNEFAAYCWLTNNELKMYDYRAANHDAQLTDGWVAQAEFKYFILSYLLYAKEEYPAVYRDIMNNEGFRLAFSSIDATFTKVVEELHKKAGNSLFRQDTYDAFVTEMKKPEYQEMLALLQA